DARGDHRRGAPKAKREGGDARDRRHRAERRSGRLLHARGEMLRRHRLQFVGERMRRGPDHADAPGRLVSADGGKRQQREYALLAEPLPGDVAMRERRIEVRDERTLRVIGYAILDACGLANTRTGTVGADDETRLDAPPALEDEPDL